MSAPGSTLGKRWYKPGRELHWSKEDKPTTRRRNALKSRRGNELKAGRALQALANVTQDKGTEKAARSDARYFFEKHKREMKHG